MVSPSMNVCQCPACCEEGDSSTREFHQLMNLFASRLDENQRRWYGGLEAYRLGRGGNGSVARIIGMSEKTIRRGQSELLAMLMDCPSDRIRRPGGGRPRKNRE